MNLKKSVFTASAPQSGVLSIFIGRHEPAHFLRFLAVKLANPSHQSPNTNGSSCNVRTALDTRESLLNLN